MKNGPAGAKKEAVALSQIRTDDLLITSEVPYHLAIRAVINTKIWWVLMLDSPKMTLLNF